MMVQDILSIVGTLIIVVGTFLMFAAGKDIFDSLLKVQKALCALSGHNPDSAAHSANDEEMLERMKSAIGEIYSESVKNSSMRRRIMCFTVSGLACITVGSSLQIVGIVVARFC